MADAIWDGLSLDPQTWTTTKPARSVAAQRGGVGPLALACGLSALLLIGGGIAARLSRPTEVVSAARLRPVKRTVVLAGAADLARALVADGLPPAVAAQAAAAARPALVASGEIKAALLLWPGSPARLDRLEISNPDSSGVVVVAQGPALSARRVAAQTGLRTVVRRGVMDADSFYSSAVAAGINDSLIPDFAKALSFDFDFQRDVHRGDAFEAAFEQPVDRSGTAVGAPRLIYASLSGASKSAAVYWFQPPGGEGGWFDSSGRSVKRALMRTPVDGARVSSTFGMRVHPVLGFEKFHKGIDFAAAVGTPVYAAGDGTIESAVPSATAGNWVRLRHDNGWETVYMHLNRFAPGVAGQGARVIQGQEIGEVGTTGRSTGPHLHYELHINNEPVDPTRIEVGGGTTLAGAALAAFGRERDRVDVSRAGQL